MVTGSQLTAPLGTCPPPCGATGLEPCGHWTGRACFEPDGPRLHPDGAPYVHGLRPDAPGPALARRIASGSTVTRPAGNRPAVPTTPKDHAMTTKPTTFADAITELRAKGVEPTDKMLVAVKQRWTVAVSPELRKQLAAVEVTPTPTVTQLSADDAFRPDLPRTTGAADSPRIVAATAEAKRLAGNAKVNAWRQRTRLQATIDLRAAQMRARTGKIAVKAVSGDALAESVA